jgi:hypothetical protein
MVVGLFIVAPTLAPTLLVARRHRREGRGHRSYDAALALVGYLFLLSVYVGVVITVPPAQQTTPTGALAPLIAVLYGLPQLVGLVPPVVGALLIVAVHRALGRR